MSGIILSMEVEAVKYVLASHSTSKQTHTAYEQTNIWWSSITVSRNSAFIVKTSFLVYSAKSIGSLFSFSFYRSFNMAQCFVWNYYSSNHKRAQSLISIWKQKKNIILKENIVCNDQNIEQFHFSSTTSSSSCHR